TWSEPEMLPALWDVLGNDSLAPEAVEGILEPIGQYYLGNHRWQPSNAPVAARVRMGTDAKAHLGAKSEWQRLVALVLLAYASKDEASTTAEKLFRESPSGSATRRD